LQVGFVEFATGPELSGGWGRVAFVIDELTLGAAPFRGSEAV
jgi:hypothetical protein